MKRLLFTGGRFRRLVGAGSVTAIGLLLLLSPAGHWWSDRSYDLLLRLRPPIDVRGDEVVIIDMDAESETAFGQLPILTWDRRLHARLVDRLRELGAHVIAFDVLFLNADGVLASADEDFLRAVRAHGRVVFGAVLQPKQSPTGETVGLEVRRPFPSEIPLEQAGLVEQSFVEDRVIRQHLGARQRVPSLAWRIAELTMAEPPGEPTTPRWVNYYGPPFTTIPHVSFHRVLSNSAPTSLSFSNKTVFVGARTLIGPTGGTGTDFHPTPFGKLITGVEINATTYLNLRRGDWLRRWSVAAEAVALALAGILMVLATFGVRPIRAAGVSVLVAAIVCVTALGLGWLAHFWFPWMIVIGAQLPAALAWRVLADRSRPEVAKPVSVLDLNPPPSTRLDSGAVEIKIARATSQPLTSAPAIPDHTMLRCVGRGAYGQVWLARDVIGTFHAVKVVYRSSFTSDAPYEREFRGMQKFTPISRNHPGWVHILHVGRNDDLGYFFYIMEAGDAQSTGQEIDPTTYQPKSLATDLEQRRRLPLQDCVDIGIGLADALDYLHSQLLVHRDIKPSNVIFVHGQPKFADVGMVTEVRNQERAVSRLGTEGYMAPEGPGTAVADLFSLGKLLYEMQTGCDRLVFPHAPTSLVEGGGTDADHALNAIIQKTCQANPRSRYQSASELREALAGVQRLLKASQQGRE